MKKILLSSAALLISLFAGAQCSTTNATTCTCADGTTNCDLLPDIEASEYAFQTYQGGPNEYPQQNAGISVNGQGPDDGRLRVSASTPNVGFGPLENADLRHRGLRQDRPGHGEEAVRVRGHHTGLHIDVQLQRQCSARRPNATYQPGRFAGQ